MLTLQGYKIHKDQIPNLYHTKGQLNVKPYVPSVFVKPLPLFIITLMWLSTSWSNSGLSHPNLALYACLMLFPYYL